MFKVSMFAVSVAAQNAIWDNYPNYVAMWSEYKTFFNKNYPEIEDSDRFEVFQGNVEKVRTVNTKNVTYTFGLTTFSDFLPSEMLALSGGVKQPVHSETIPDDTYLGRHVWNGEALPESVDWTTQGAVTPAKDQKICGSCWAFSAVASLEGANALASGNLVSLSEQQAMQCGSPTGRGCEGGWPDNVFKYALSGQDDFCTEDAYPYQGVDTIPCFWNVPHTCSTVGVKKGEVAGFKDVDHTMEAMMSAVAQQPVSVAVGGSGHWGNYAGGVYTDCDVGVGHAVTVVGYGTEAGGKYWKLKNSWGTGFGIDGGYILIGRDRGVAEGECGLFVHASYPVMANTPKAVQV